MRVALAVSVFVLLTGVSSAWATFPGRNGQLSFSAYSLNEESTDVIVEDYLVGIANVPRGSRRFVALGSSPSFSPDGRRLAYVKDDYEQGIWVTRPDCEWPRHKSSPSTCSRLRHLTRGDDYSPAWSPNGKRIAFTRRNSSIYTVRASGGGLHFLARGNTPDWSSKGALAFTGPHGVLQVRRPGGQRRTLRVAGVDPSWAPGGNRLAFVQVDQEKSTRALYTIRADGTGLRELWESHDPNGQFAGAFSPSWSPDGQWVAFIKEFDPIFSGPVYAVRPDGSGRRLLMFRPPDCRFCAGDLNFDSIAWQAVP
jgi:Tol biopolymer transport system component